jgi:hypothetical protein
MPAALGRLWWGPAAAAALVLAACSSSTAPQPQLSNPQQLSTNLQTVSGVVSSPTFNSFGALRTASGSPVAAPTVPGALLGAAPITPPATSAQAYAGAPARLQALRLAAASLGSGIAASVIPPTQLGKTYVWDVTTHAYVAQTGGPTNGVRVILYAVNSSDQVIEPTTAVGYVDLLDESTSSTNTLHVLVYGGTPTSQGTKYADYKVSGTVTGSPATAFNASATGSVTDGTHTLTFNASFAATQLNTTTPNVQIDVTWSLDNPAVSVTLSETVAASDANHLTLTIHFTETYAGETVGVDGTLAVVVSPQGVTANLTVKVNGQTFATITGTADATHPNGIQVSHADGSALSTAEQAALASLFDLPDKLEKAIDDLFHPCEHLMGA